MTSSNQSEDFVFGGSGPQFSPVHQPNYKICNTNRKQHEKTLD
jgi:hypothetical protein